MATNMNSELSAFADKENMKTDLLDILIDLYSNKGLILGDKAKDFVLIRAEQLINYYNVSTEIEVKRFKLINNELSEPCVSIEKLNKVFEDFGTKISQILLQLLSYDLGQFIEDSLNKE